METSDLSKKFMWLAVFNGLLALVFTVPILIPSLCIATPPGNFGCQASMETIRPGTWLLFAYFSFLVVGVLGALAWSVLYTQQGTLSGKNHASKNVSWLQLLLFEIGLLVATGMMAAVGWTGGNFIAHGGGVAVSSEVIRTQIIPPLSSDLSNPLSNMPTVIVAVGIGVSVLAQAVGLLNFWMLKKTQ